jgi:hypothetical protein
MNRLNLPMRWLIVFAIFSVACNGSGHDRVTIDSVTLTSVQDDKEPVPPPPPEKPATNKMVRRIVVDSSLFLDKPLEGDTIYSPATVAGKARGSWFFEGQFQLKLHDTAGRLIALTSAKATSNWMTKDFVPFKGELQWKKYRGRAIMVAEADNPSGMAEKARSITYNIFLAGQ